MGTSYTILVRDGIELHVDERGCKFDVCLTDPSREWADAERVVTISLDEFRRMVEAFSQIYSYFDVDHDPINPRAPTQIDDDGSI